MKYKDLRKLIPNKTLNDLVFKIKSTITDPRSNKPGCGVLIYSLELILFIIIIARICGIQPYRGIEYFAKTHRGFLEKYFHVELKKIRKLMEMGIAKRLLPSDDTYRRLIEIIIPEELFKIYEWLLNRTTEYLLKRTHIAIDGKCLRGTKTSELRAKDIVSALDSESLMVINQKEVQEKKNEVSGILVLLSSIDEAGYKDLVITIDAIAANPDVFKAIARRGWDYCIGLKQNQPTCYAEAYNLLLRNLKNYFASEYSEEHGIQVERRFYFFNNLDNFYRKEDFKGFKSIGAIISFGIRDGEEFAEVRFFFTSLIDKNEFKDVSRSHWRIENNLHRTEDVIYEEDKSHIRKANAPLNMNILRKIGLIILHLGKSYSKDSNITFKILIDIFKMNPEIINSLLHDDFVSELA